jgi:rubredoxin
MDKWQCKNCGYIYDPQLGDPDNDIEPETDFEDLPKKWVCPDCGAKKGRFDIYEEEEDEYRDDDEDREY